MTDLIERPNAKHFNFTIGVNEDGILYVPFREVVDNIQSFQTVEAIPVEWIENYIEDNFESPHPKCDAYAIIYEWRKEQRKEE